MLAMSHNTALHSARHPARRLTGVLPRLALGLVMFAALLVGDLGEAGAVEQAPFSGHWIDVNLSRLTVTAYDGSKAVYSAPVTAGKRGYATPTGTFRIYRRVRVTDMRSNPGDREQYYVKNVQYVQYFKSGGYAIHSNYWAPDSVFGRSFTSHGCVSMRLKHAAFLWSFADVGTPVYIHYNPPTVPVAEVVGKSQGAAKSQLQSAGFKVAVNTRATTASAPGIVLDQRPGSGTSALKGSTITLTVAVEPPIVATSNTMGMPIQPVLPYGDPGPGSTWAPAVVGLPEAAAVGTIERAGLRATHVRYVGEGDVPLDLRASVKAAKAGTVVWALESPGFVLPRGVDYVILVKQK